MTAEPRRTDRPHHYCAEASPKAPPSPQRRGGMGWGGSPLAPAPAAILIGPEDGASVGESAKLCQKPNVTPLSLDPRIVRADTAAVAALALCQATAGDWR